jgi:hypothetical protein
MVVLDIAPTLTMYDMANLEFATRYFWWFFLIQPADLPERMIGSDPEYFLRRHIGGQSKTDGAIGDDVIAEYLRCYRDPATIHAICEDYRASASIDLEHDRADSDRRITAPVLAIWGAKGVVGSLYDVAQTWRDKAVSVQGTALPCGHAIPEEQPEALCAQIRGNHGIARSHQIRRDLAPDDMGLRMAVQQQDRRAFPGHSKVQAHAVDNLIPQREPRKKRRSTHRHTPSRMASAMAAPQVLVSAPPPRSPVRSASS